MTINEADRPPRAKSTPPPRPDRDRAVDVARLAALIVVMFGHCALLLATIDTSGVRIGNLLGELPAIAPITWVVQVMPLFFLAGGAAGAYGWRAGTPVGHMAVHPGPATVQAGVLVPRRVVDRAPGDSGDSGPNPRQHSDANASRFCGSSASTWSSLAFVPALTRFAPAAARRCHRIAARRRCDVRRDPNRGRDADDRPREFRSRLAYPRRHRCGLRTTTAWPAHRTGWPPWPRSPHRWSLSWSGRTTSRWS